MGLYYNKEELIQIIKALPSAEEKEMRNYCSRENLFKALRFAQIKRFTLAQPKSFHCDKCGKDIRVPHQNETIVDICPFCNAEATNIRKFEEYKFDNY